MAEKEFDKEIVAHLEFLGFQIENLELETGHMYLASSDNRPNLVVRTINSTTILTTRFRDYSPKSTSSKDFFQTLNSINQEALSKWYCQEDAEDDDVRIVIENDYYGYDKTTFGALLDNMHSEIVTHLPKFSKFLKK